LKVVFSYLRNYKKECFWGPFFKMLEAVLELFVPYLMAKIIDIGIKKGDNPYIFRTTAIIAVMAVVGLSFALICQYLAAKCGYGFGTDLRQALYSKINSFSHSEVDKFGVSSLTNRLTHDTVIVQEGVNMFIRLGFRAPFIFVGSIVMSMFINAKLSVILLISAVLVSLIVYTVMRKTIPMHKAVQKKLDKTALLVRENLDGVRVIRAFSRQANEVERFNAGCDDLADTMVRVNKIAAVSNPLTFMLLNLGITAVLWFGGVTVNVGGVTAGELTALVNYMTQILLAIMMVTNLMLLLTRTFASANRIAEVLECEPTVISGDVSELFGEECISFNNVSFAYEGAADMSLNNITFSLKHGEKLGIIGSTGSGKTTLVNLIPRFYDVTEGSITVYGNDIQDYKIGELRRTIATVPQKSSLFSGTVRENLQLGDENANDKSIVRALKTAQAWDFVEQIGLDAHISQSGKNLSGGQKQRISIARALVGMPRIIILDDSTSALDYETDMRLRQALSKNTNSTIIMISQRVDSIKDFDKIIVMDEGNAVGIGTHDELLSACEVYREIYISQKGASHEAQFG